jgi:MerR family transcriptional regulator, light-induced transcriptional regulator
VRFARLSIFFDISLPLPESVRTGRLADRPLGTIPRRAAMTDGTDRANRTRGNADSGSTVETLASRALGVLASKRVSAASLLSERFLEELSIAVRTLDADHRWSVVRKMLESRIRLEDIADFYIPEVSRRLGAAWCEDGLSFADVTIGVARLQSLLREIDAEWAKGTTLDADAPGLLVVVLADEFHTLGAMVLCSQLGRMGVSVKLVVGQSESEVLRTVAAGQFDAILISASGCERLAPLRKLVEKVRAACLRPTPIVLGGSVVTRVTDAKTQTGADHATTDPREALRACGLRILVPGATRRATSE